jgi:hypothetical protein
MPDNTTALRHHPRIRTGWADREGSVEGRGRRDPPNVVTSTGTSPGSRKGLASRPVDWPRGLLARLAPREQVTGRVRPRPRHLAVKLRYNLHMNNRIVECHLQFPSFSDVDRTGYPFTSLG